MHIYTFTGSIVLYFPQTLLKTFLKYREVHIYLEL